MHHHWASQPKKCIWRGKVLTQSTLEQAPNMLPSEAKPIQLPMCEVCRTTMLSHVLHSFLINIHPSAVIQAEELYFKLLKQATTTGRSEDWFHNITMGSATQWPATYHVTGYIFSHTNRVGGGSTYITSYSSLRRGSLGRAGLEKTFLLSVSAKAVLSDHFGSSQTLCTESTMPTSWYPRLLIDPGRGLATGITSGGS